MVPAFDGAWFSTEWDDAPAQILHGSATTTDADRRAIQDSRESLRALARDYFTNLRFRCDVYVPDGKRLSERARHDRVFDSTYMLTRAAGDVKYAMETSAGQLSYDSDAARAVVAGLTSGPRRLKDIADGRTDRNDLLASALALCAAEMVRPVEAGRESAAGLNRAICARLGRGSAIAYLAVPNGTAFAAPDEVIRKVKAGGTLDRAFALPPLRSRASHRQKRA